MEGGVISRICFLSSTHTPRDKRVFAKEAVSLARAGFEVMHLAPDEVAGRETEAGVTLVTYRRRPGLLGRLSCLSRLYAMARRLEASYYHCNEVDSWVVGAALKLRTGAGLVFDAHEEYPRTFAERRLPPWLRPPVVRALRWLLRRLSVRSDRIVLAKRSLSTDYAPSGTRCVLVQNFTSIEQVSGLAFPTRFSAAEEEPFVAIHIGLIGRARGWGQMLEALRLGPASVRLHLVGKFDDDSRGEFDRRVIDLGLADRVSFEDWLPFPRVFENLLAADVGLVLFQPGLQNHVFALPHKMFDYMLAGLPVIVPKFAVEVAELVEEAGCGITLDSASPTALAEALAELQRDSAWRKRLGERGRAAVKVRYNWEAEAGKLVAMYRELDRERRS